MSIDSNTVPDDFKSARVTPLYKKNGRHSVGNYRPVSILSVASIFLEKAVYIQLEQYLTQNNLLYDFQSGFRSGYSTDTCLTYLTDYIKSQLSIGNYTGMILIDLQKAFDTVDHTILCAKLKNMGIQSVPWFRSYLTGRKQIVSVNKTESEPLPISCGVPQGSILCPLLFLCYVNDMSISVKCKLLLYADDSALLVSGKDPKSIAEELSAELYSCSQWLVDNKLSLHLGKTECILFGSKRRLKRVNNFKIVCNDHTIESVQSVKYLGIHLDQCVSGVSTANNILKKASSRLRFLYRQSSFLNKKSKCSLYSALIQCHFDYSSSSWYQSLTQNLKKKIQILQNKAVRFILKRDSRAHIGQTELDEVNMLNTSQRVTQLRLNHMFKIFRKTSPPYLQENFSRVTDQHKYITRDSQYNFYVPRVNSLTQNSFFYTATLEWNSLPSCIKEINNYNSFKKNVKKHLRNKSHLEEKCQFTK